MIHIPNMLLIGGADRNAGKTRLARGIIEKFRARFDLVGVKITVIREGDKGCPRGGEGCGVCSSLEGNYLITEEMNPAGSKDTSLLLAAGAKRVFWLRVLKRHLQEGVEKLLDVSGRDEIYWAEGNSPRLIVEPGIFLMVQKKGSDRLKETAAAVRDGVDQWVTFDGEHCDLDPNRLDVAEGKWILRLPVTAVILAGGKSSRMGCDKSLVTIQSRPMIEHIYCQLRPHFDQVCISANDPEKYAFLGLKIISDQIADQGPLMGIASALEASEHDRTVFVACDIPQVNIPLIQRLLREVQGHDGAVPRIGPHIEPLFAVYRKTMLPAIREALAEGQRKIRDAFTRCDIHYVDITEEQGIANLNTKQDYETYQRNDNG